MTYRYHHLHLICSDLEEMIQFFTETLGAHLIRRRKFGTADGAMLDLQGTPVNLRVARQDEDVSGDSARERYGYDHLGLEVDDVDAAFRELKGKGFRFMIEPRDVEDVRVAFFKGPDNVTMELIQRL
jgi:catechol 2,3-dioxygenase-like lactoylglutathione lyase family enzyme